MGERELVGVGMGATEDRAVWFGGCRRPRLGRRRVRHPVELAGTEGWWRVAFENYEGQVSITKRGIKRIFWGDSQRRVCGCGCGCVRWRDGANKGCLGSGGDNGETARGRQVRLEMELLLTEDG